MSHDDKQRRLDNEQARQRRSEATERKRRAALRILDSGGTVKEAAAESGACRRTVKRWDTERKAKR
jgi:transposase-like protein